MKQFKTNAENFADTVRELRAMSAIEFKRAELDAKRNAGAYQTFYIRAMAAVSYERALGKRIVNL